ncbi:MAG: AraC family transcriptional regulator, partial [Eubacterium sp.]|nr:AraC family transcriptional regulator [Eubacterium sp.]
MATNNIRYLYNAETGIELIFCDNSTISYPLHNHVSVLTVGIILDGSVILTTNQETKVYKQNETFAIFPYVPHSISAHDSYTLLSLCIDKNMINNVDITTLQKHIALLLMQALNMEKINQYQILQLLNCLDEIAGSSEWQLIKHTSYIHDLKKQLELYPECKLTVDEMAQNAFISKYHFIRS